jgi:hypothetical protein
MGQDDDSSNLEHRQTRKVPDQTTAELMRELEGEVTNPRIRMPVRRGATYTALVPPPAHVIPGASQGEISEEEPTAAFEPVPDESDVRDVAPRRRDWVRWVVVVGSALGLVVLGLGAWVSYVKLRETEAVATIKEKRPTAPSAQAPATTEKAPTKQAPPAPAKAETAPASTRAIPDDTDGAAAQETEAEDGAPERADTDSGEAPEPIDAAALAMAIKGRKIRELDHLLVSRMSLKKRSYDKAEAYCNELEVAGVSGWRLPEIGELYSLSGARLVRRHVFWSKTVGDASGDRRLTWNAKRRRIRPLSPKWRGGRTVCVRARP